jgi:hypothetical protein
MQDVTIGRQALSLLARLLLGLALLTVAGFAPAPLALAAPTAEATGTPIDPREIALTLADLQPGFAVDTSVTGLTILPDSVGVSLRVDMRRPATAQSLADGPIIVQQIIVRLDAPVAATDVLASIRDELIRDTGLTPTPDGPNDGGTVSLKRQDGEVILYSVGFVKENLVVFTTAGGLAQVTTFPKLVELAGITSSRLDAHLARR